MWYNGNDKDMQEFLKSNSQFDAIVMIISILNKS